MSEEEIFLNQCQNEIRQQGSSISFNELTRQWLNESTKTKYSYHFEWLGRPIIQYPQDIVAMQGLLWAVKPDLIIETGVARGGSIIFYASILELIAQCGGPKNASVLGIDIDIRENNKKAILAHPMSKRIDLIEGSSIDEKILDQVKKKAVNSKRIMVCLDSNHTHDHVLEELRLYSPLVTINSYLIVFDTIIEFLPDNLIGDRPWSKGNNPKTAVEQYLKECDLRGDGIRFQIDEKIENQLMITVASGGYLKRIS